MEHSLTLLCTVLTTHIHATCLTLNSPSPCPSTVREFMGFLWYGKPVYDLNIVYLACYCQANNKLITNELNILRIGSTPTCCVCCSFFKKYQFLETHTASYTTLSNVNLDAMLYKSYVKIIISRKLLKSLASKHLGRVKCLRGKSSSKSCIYIFLREIYCTDRIYSLYKDKLQSYSCNKFE